MKRTLSLILTLAMLITMFTAFTVATTTSVAAATVISNTSPAITANVNDTINLANYSVTFDDGTVASNLTWKKDGATITSFKPTSKGVTTLTATSGSKTKNIYVVAKKSTESEYVLYEANMSDFASVQALKNAGWTMNGSSSASYTKASDGSLNLGVTGEYDLAYAYLPAWIGDFGDYKIEANVKIASLVNNNTSRWFSTIYRSDSNTTEGHYFQMAVRDAASNSGVEFAERYNAAWNVPSKGSASITSMSSAYNTVKIEAFGGYISQSINGNQIIYLDSTAFKSNAKNPTYKGYVGFSMCGGTLSVKNVKVTLQTAIPEENVTVGLINNNNHKGENLVNPIANAQRVNPVNATTLNGLSVAFFNAADGNVTDAVKACVNAKVVPTIYVATNAQADLVVSAANSVGTVDINVVSSNASVLAYLRGKNSAIRTGLRIDLSSKMADGILTPEEANAVRIEVRKAPATFCVVDSSYLTRDAVAELQEFAVAVWAVISNKSTGTKADYDTEVMKVLTAGVNGIVSDSAAAVYDLIETHFEDNSFTRTPLIIGHRGNPSCAPENTIPSFQAAYDNGADVFEIDVDITKDNVVVVLHDGTLDRTTTYDDGDPNAWGGTHVNNMTWAEVQKYYVLENDGVTSTGKPIPTLAEVLEWARGKDVKIFVEFKSAAASCITQTMNKIKELDMAHQVDIISFAPSALTQAQAGIPGMSTGYLLPNTIDATTYLKALQQLEPLIKSAQGVNSTVNVQSYGGQATRHSLQAASDRGMTVWPWTYNTSTTDKAFFSAADGITTDDVEIIKHMVKTVYAEDTNMVVGQTYIGGTVTAETYGNERYLAEPEAVVASVIAGDAVKVDNGKLVAVKAGTATVVFGYRTKTAAGTDYVVYGQPVQVKVNNDVKASAESLFDIGNIPTVNNLSENDLITLRQLQNKALDIANGVQTATEAELIALSNDIAKILNNFYELVPFTPVSYTAPAPNYYKWDAANQKDSDELNEVYVDDGIRLIDGKKGSTSTTTSAYSVWGKQLNVEVVLDYGTAINARVFRGYFASYGDWGVKFPTDMKVYYSNDKTSWTEVKGNLAKEVTVDGTWDLSTYTYTADEAVTARYIKFYVDPESYFTWVDEFEVSKQIGDKVSGDYVYITDINTRVNNGDAIVFTSKSNPINAAEENHNWTFNIIAKYDAEIGEYIVTSAAKGDGNVGNINLANDEILIAVHDWESKVKDYTAVKGSAQNYKNSEAATVGKVVKLYGIDPVNGILSAAPYVRFTNVDVTHKHSYSTKWSSDSKYHWHECECTDKVDMNEHTPGSWEMVTPATETESGLREKHCTVCDAVTDSQVIPPYNDGTNPNPNPDTPVLIGLRGDVNLNEKIDSRDYLLLKRGYFGTTKLSAEATLVADVNNNGKIDSRDYMLLKRLYFGTYKIDEAIKYVYTK